jgi:hypothetical protein
MVAVRESESALTAAVKRGRYTRDQRDAVRRRESPQPEFGPQAVGHPGDLPEPASPTPADGDATPGLGGAGASTSAPAGRAAKPFDEIEDY